MVDTLLIFELSDGREWHPLKRRASVHILVAVAPQMVVCAAWYRRRSHSLF